MFLAWSLNGGGAERKCAVLANEIARRGYAVSILTICTEHPNDYPLHSAVRRMSMNDSAVNQTSYFNRTKSLLRRLWIVRKTIQRENPFALVSVGHAQAVLGIIGRKSRRMDFLWTTSSTHAFDTGHVRFRLLRHFSKRGQLTLIAQTETIQDEYLSIGFNDTITIPNPVHIPPVPVRQRSSERPIRIITVGRLVSEKSYEDLIDALALLKDAKTDWTCQIIGEGPLQGELKERCRSHGLERRVEFTGWVGDVRAALQQSDLFVMTSSVEGQPNALLEAMSESLPCISTDFKGGSARTLLASTRAGIVVPVGDKRAIADSIQSLMEDQDQRRELGARGRNAVMPFSSDRVTDRWVEVLRLKELRSG